MSVNTEYVWFITGANRGIGLELTKQLLQSPSNAVLAACRNPGQATALQALVPASNGRLHVLPLDVTDRQFVRDAREAATAILGDKGIDYLINNAAINLREWDSAFTLEPDVMQQVFETNVVGPAYITQVFLPLVEKSEKKTVVNVSSELGRFNADFGTRSTSYSIAKAGLNMLTYKQQKERPDIIFISLCPGWLRTDMGGQEAPDDVSVGVEGVIKTVVGLTPADSGKFFNSKGQSLSW
ncbi:NAD-P-binding protein [Trametes coccinea BRFM310]|uniref:NAD-P-binding protein n=1 Tax=Trametes coccinea (strain BRFM310) TaxID=1353009 RepID=A0A1Y2I870_TRAC3|nr:NAD-P-binding protein [Trametes coccinea BRFM310]